MARRRIDYNNISTVYDERYRFGGPTGIAETLKNLVGNTSTDYVFEVGCGTGYWLARLPTLKFRCGLDFSAGMLAEARRRDASMDLVRGTASVLPFAEQTFDVVICIHALHHFDDPRLFIKEAWRVLRTSGKLAIIGMDPQTEQDRWYIYDYFPGTRETDLTRYPSGIEILGWMDEAGFSRCERYLVARIAHTFHGRAVLKDPILHKNGTSQLSLLTEEAFSTGMARIKEEIQLAEENNREITLSMDITIPMVIGLAGAEA
jgi:SAM-dependent methyltransferase